MSILDDFLRAKDLVFSETRGDEVRAVVASEPSVLRLKANLIEEVVKGIVDSPSMSAALPDFYVAGIRIVACEELEGDEFLMFSSEDDARFYIHQLKTAKRLGMNSRLLAEVWCSATRVKL